MSPVDGTGLEQWMACLVLACLVLADMHSGEDTDVETASEMPKADGFVLCITVLRLNATIGLQRGL